jgi:hypothetical protein
MAKISTRGDTERARWRHPQTGAELVLTVRGRLLLKAVRGGSFTLVANLRNYYRDHGFEEAKRRAERRGMVKV